MVPHVQSRPQTAAKRCAGRRLKNEMPAAGPGDRLACLGQRPQFVAEGGQRGASVLCVFRARDININHHEPRCRTSKPDVALGFVSPPLANRCLVARGIQESTAPPGRLLGARGERKDFEPTARIG